MPCNRQQTSIAPVLVRCWHLYATLMEAETHSGLAVPSVVTWMKFSFAIASSPYKKGHLGAVTMVLYLDGVLGLPMDATHRSWMSLLVPTSTAGLYCVITMALHKGTLVHPLWMLWQVKFYVFSVLYITPTTFNPEYTLLYVTPCMCHTIFTTCSYACVLIKNSYYKLWLWACQGPN